MSRPRSCLFACLAALAVGCVTQTKAAPTAPPPSAPPTLAQLSQACSILTREGLPCRSSFEGELWFMVTHFESEAVLQQTADKLLSNIGVPFCQATRAYAHKAKFVVDLHGVGTKQFDCLNARWSEWTAPAPLPNFSALSVEAACMAIDRSPAVGLNCKLRQSNGMFKMVIAAHSLHDMQLYANWLDQQVVNRYCKQLVDAAAGGTVELQMVSEKKARIVNCETGTTSTDLELHPRSRPPPAQAPTQRPQQAQPSSTPATQYL